MGVLRDLIASAVQSSAGSSQQSDVYYKQQEQRPTAGYTSAQTGFYQQQQVPCTCQQQQYNQCTHSVHAPMVLPRRERLLDRMHDRRAMHHARKAYRLSDGRLSFTAAGTAAPDTGYNSQNQQQQPTVGRHFEDRSQRSVAAQADYDAPPQYEERTEVRNFPRDSKA